MHELTAEIGAWELALVLASAFQLGHLDSARALRQQAQLCPDMLDGHVWICIPEAGQ